MLSGKRGDRPNTHDSYVDRPGRGLEKPRSTQKMLEIPLTQERLADRTVPAVAKRKVSRANKVNQERGTSQKSKHEKDSFEQKPDASGSLGGFPRINKRKYKRTRENYLNQQGAPAKARISSVDFDEFEPLRNEEKAEKKAPRGKERRPSSTTGFELGHRASRSFAKYL